MQCEKPHSQFKDFGSMKILLSENLSKRQSGALSFTNVRLYIRPSVQNIFVKDFTASTGQNDLIFGLELQLVRYSSAVRRLLWTCCSRGTSESSTYGKQLICLSNSWSAHFHVSWLSDFIF